uniref:Uncharacterized protein n=1 Tax=Cannabis sativa TaxID=3483 RepID=A0A803RBM3_CANSA
MKELYLCLLLPLELYHILTITRGSSSYKGKKNTKMKTKSLSAASQSIPNQSNQVSTMFIKGKL